MAVATETTKHVYSGSESTGPFPISFPFFSDDDLEVIRVGTGGGEDELTVDVDFTVSGGLLTLTNTLASGEKLVIKRRTPYLQPQNYSARNKFSATAANTALDKLEHQIQQIRETAERALQVPRDMDGPRYVRPSANKLLGWDSAGENLQNYDLTAILSIPSIDTLENHENSLAQAVSDIGSGSQILAITGPTTVTAGENVIVPYGVEVWPLRGARITVQAGATLQIQQLHAPGAWEWIYIEDGGTLTFGERISEVCAEWFGYGTQRGLQFAIDSLPEGGSVLLAKNTITLEAAPNADMTARPYALRGQSNVNLVGLNWPILQQGEDDINLLDLSNITGVTVRGIVFDGNDKGINLDSVQRETAYSAEAPDLAVAGNFVYRCVVSGTTAAIAPSWPASVGETVEDGTVTWECVRDYRVNRAIFSYDTAPTSTQKDVVVEHCRFTDMAQFAATFNGAGGGFYSSNVRVEDCELRSMRDEGFNFYYINNWKVLGCRAYDHEKECIKGSAGNDVEVSGNTIYCNGIAYAQGPLIDMGMQLNDVTIHGNKCYQGYIGIASEKGGSRLTVTNNVCVGQGYRGITGSTNRKNAGGQYTFANNVVANPGGSPDLPAGAGGQGLAIRGVDAEPIEAVVVSGNQVIGATGSAFAVLGIDMLTMFGNIAYDSGQSGFALSDIRKGTVIHNISYKSELYGIRLTHTPPDSWGTWTNTNAPLLPIYYPCVPTVTNGYYYKVSAITGGAILGETGETEPTWPTEIGETVVDGDLTWECVDYYQRGNVSLEDNLIIDANMDGTDETLDGIVVEDLEVVLIGGNRIIDQDGEPPKVQRGIEIVESDPATEVILTKPNYVSWTGGNAIFAYGLGNVAARAVTQDATYLSNGLKWLSGSGTPEGNVTAPVGSVYLRTNGGAGTTLYIKESGDGNTGWVAK